MKIELTMDEARALFEIIDMAVKAHGVSIAMSAAVLAKRVDDAVRAEIAAQAFEQSQAVSAD